MLYRVMCLCKIPKLGEVVLALKGLTVGKVEFDLITGHPEDKEPAKTHTPTKKSSSRAFKGRGRKKPPGEGLPDIVAATLINNPPDLITTEVIRKLVIKLGGQGVSVYFVTRKLRKLGVLRAHKEKGSNRHTFTLHPEAFQKYMEKDNETA